MAKKFTKLVIGGAQLPSLANPASTSEIFDSKEAIDQSGNKITGTFTIENELSTQEDLISQISTLVAQKANPSGGVELPDLTNPAAASDILSGKEAIDENGNVITGTIATKTSSNLTASGATVTVPAGYYASNATKSVATATQATPSVSINASGKISASATQTAGYVAAGTKTGTKQLTTQAAKTITPTTSSQTAVAKNVYTTGVVTVGAIPSNYEDVATETTEYTSLNAELEEVINALPDAGGSGGSSIDTCTVTITTDGTGFLQGYSATVVQNGEMQAVYVSSFMEPTPFTINNCVCGSAIVVDFGHTWDAGVIIDGDGLFISTSSFGAVVLQASSVPGSTVTFTLYDDE